MYERLSSLYKVVPYAKTSHEILYNNRTGNFGIQLVYVILTIVLVGLAFLVGP